MEELEVHMHGHSESHFEYSENAHKSIFSHSEFL